MSSSASVLLVIAALGPLGYLAAGALMAVFVDVMLEESEQTRMRFVSVAFGWPIILYVAAVALLAIQTPERGADET